jgi:hypothetical protein
MKLLAGLVLPWLLSARILAPPGPSPDAFVGGTLGVVDGHNHYVIPSRFSKVEYLGFGLYQTTDIDFPNKYTLGKGHALYDHDGHRLVLEVPAGCTFERVFWLGKKAQVIRGQHFHHLPPAALLQIRNGDKLGVCDVHGTIVVPVEYDQMEQPGDGLSIISQGDRVSLFGRKGGFVFNAEDHSLKPVEPNALVNLDDRYSDGMHIFWASGGGAGYLGSDGQIAIPAKYFHGGPFVNGCATVSLRCDGQANLWRYPQIDKTGKEILPESPIIAQERESEKGFDEQPASKTTLFSREASANGLQWGTLWQCEDNRFIEHILPARKNFDSIRWKCSRGINRENQFGDFLKDYHLIGMTRRAVCDVLGEERALGTRNEVGEPLYYTVVFGGCQGMSAYVQVSFNGDDKVDHWCFYERGEVVPPIIKEDVFPIVDTIELKTTFVPHEVTKGHWELIPQDGLQPTGNAK